MTSLCCIVFALRKANSIMPKYISSPLAKQVHDDKSLEFVLLLASSRSLPPRPAPNQQGVLTPTMSGSKSNKHPRASPDPPVQDHPGTGSRAYASSSTNRPSTTTHSDPPAMITSASAATASASTPTSKIHIDSDLAPYTKRALEVVVRCGNPDYPNATMEIGQAVRGFKDRLKQVREVNDRELALHRKKLERCAEGDSDRLECKKIVEGLEEEEQVLAWSLQAIENIADLGKLKRLRALAESLKTKVTTITYLEYENVRRKSNERYKSCKKSYDFDGDLEKWLTGWKGLEGIDPEEIKRWTKDLTTGNLSIEDEKRAVRGWINLNTEDADSITDPEAIHAFWKEDILSNERMAAAISDEQIRSDIERVYAEIGSILKELKRSGKVGPDLRLKLGGKENEHGGKGGSGSKKKKKGSTSEN
jgi:Sec-independent protein translocase protein TatA